jgi:hypothetical protein
MEIFMKILLDLAANMAIGKECYHLGSLGGFVEADHFLVEFLSMSRRNAEDVLAGLREEDVHHESVGACVGVPEALGAGE